MERLVEWVTSWYGSGILLVAFIFALFVCFCTQRLSSWIVKRIVPIAVIIWLSGVLLYWIGYSTWSSCKGNYFTLVIRSVLSSIEMFASVSHLREIKFENWGDNQIDQNIYMMWFALQRCLAVLTSAIFVIHIFGLQLNSAIKMFWWRIIASAKQSKLTSNKKTKKFCLIKSIRNWQAKRNKNTFIFFGMDKRSFILAEELCQKEIGRIIFLNYENKSPDYGKHRYNFSYLLGISRSFERETKIVVEQYGGIVLKYKGDRTLKRLLKLDGKLRFMFLSDDEAKNIEQYKKIHSRKYLPKQRIMYYCHAQRCTLNNVILHNNSLLQLVDSSYLSVLGLKQDKKAHPVNFVDLEVKNGESTGVVTSRFGGLVIGFGDTGKEALGFMYEFSAFVGVNGKRSPYKLTAIDDKMSRIKGEYLAERPALKENRNIELCELEVNSVDYWAKINDLISQCLNYVIISLGDDKLNIQTAINLHDHICRQCSKENRKFVIYVRKQASSIYDTTELYNDNTIRFFGSNKDVFTVKLVFNKEHTKNAGKFKSKYDEIKKAYVEKDASKSKAPSNKPTPIEKWRSKIRKQSQDLANSYHMDTKLYLLTNGSYDKELLKKLDKLRRIPQSAVEYAGEYHYEDENGSKLEEESRLMTNLAKTEHLRWNAAIELLGYTKNKNISECNELTMKHNCLTSWEGLHEIWKALKDKEQYSEFKQFDYNVVETSINLFTEMSKEYIPSPENTDDVVLPKQLSDLVETMAKNVHETWAQTRIEQGWSYGAERNDEKKQHPCLVPYEELPDSEREYDRNTAIETIKLIIKLGWKITK